jgi:hypothetical protein
MQHPGSMRSIIALAIAALSALTGTAGANDSELPLSESEAVRLHSQMREYAGEYRKSLAQALRRMRPMTLLTSALLLETGYGFEHDLEEFLRLASIQYAKRIARANVADVIAYREGRRDPASLIIAEVLNRIAVTLPREGHTGLRDAFERAWDTAKRSRPKDYRRGDREDFFVLVKLNRMDWLQRTEWDKIGRTAPPEPLYKVEGNVINVRFSSCGDKLKE